MRQYLNLLTHILNKGKDRGDRTGTGTRSLFGPQVEYDLQDGFPLLTTKRIDPRGFITELCWFLSGSTNEHDLIAMGGTKIWSAWATAEQCAKFGRKAGDLGPVYGKQWTNFGATPRGDGTYEADGINQIANVIEQIKANPNSRRLIVSSWHAREADMVTLPPCHTMYQLYVDEGEISLKLYQRSGDAFLGVPFNIASYALLLSLIAHVTGLKPRRLIHTFGDVHLYLNHLEQARLQISREPRSLPRLILRPDMRDVFAFTPADMTLVGYDPHDQIKAEVSV